MEVYSVALLAAQEVSVTLLTVSYYSEPQSLQRVGLSRLRVQPRVRLCDEHELRAIGDQL